MKMREVTVIFLSSHGISSTVGLNCSVESLGNVNKTEEKDVLSFLKTFMSGLQCYPRKRETPT